MPAMTGRAVEPVEIPPACPFVAFEDDRERRSTAPDHRHRCYAEPRPAPRALAHQERYCLTRDFPSCPTFQARARREAAPKESDPAAVKEVAAGRPPVDPGAWVAQPAAASTSRYAPPAARGDIGQLAAFDDAEPEQAEEASEAEPTDEGGGHAELAALVGGAAAAAAGPAAASAAESSDAPAFLAGRASGTRTGASGPRTGRARRHASPCRQATAPTPAVGAAAAPGALPEPAHSQRPPVRAPGRPCPHRPIVAAVVLFLLPSLLPGNNGTTPTGSPGASDSAAATSIAPTLAAGPTPLVYTVKSGDLLSTIAAKFHVTLAELEAANPQITDPNKIKVGDKITIPVPGASLPASATP